MATFLDVAGLEYFSNLFVFLFVWIIVYAVLSYTKALGDHRALDALIGLIIAIFVILSPIAAGTIRYISPWFALIFVFIILITVVLKMLGASPADISSFQSLKWGVIILVVFIILFGA